MVLRLTLQMLCRLVSSVPHSRLRNAVVDLAFGDDSFEQDRSLDDFGMIDHFRHLGYAPKFYRVQDASFARFIRGSSIC